MKTAKGFAIVPVLVVAFLVLGLGVSLYATQQNQNLAKRASEESPNPSPPPPCTDGQPLGTCITGCPSGTTGTCGGHVYCEGGRPGGGCSCETEEQTCIPTGGVDSRCSSSECYEGGCIALESYRECDASCGAGQSVPVKRKKSSTGACEYEKGSCSPDAACVENPGEHPKADINMDGKIDLNDLGQILDNFGSQMDSPSPVDLNSDGKIDIVDIGIFINSFSRNQ